MESAQQFQLPPGITTTQLEDVLTGDFTIRLSEPVFSSLAFYDTFDWRLFNKSLVLQESDDKIQLRSLPDGLLVAQILATAPPAFAQGFPESALKDVLLPIVAPRALLKLSEGKSESRTYRILNTDEKTVAILALLKVQPAEAVRQNPNSDPASFHQVYPHTQDHPQSPVTYLDLQPVRGYSKHSKKLAELLEENGVLPVIWQDYFLRMLASTGVIPGGYSSKIAVTLDPQMRADHAAKIILIRLLEVIKANEAGIRADIDPEFLHDFRVAIRRTRSALSQVPQVFPAEITERFRQDFSNLGSFTNRLRDLDVYLLAEDDYKSMLPAGMRQDINPLFDFLRSHRSQALQEVIAFMDSNEYNSVLQDWQDFLSSPPAEQEWGGGERPANAAVPIITLSSRRISRWYWRVIEDGKALVSQPQDVLMHALRIKCKKLRYLIEFFESLYPPKQVSILVNQLKSLQDNLGEFNDLSVQQAYLQKIAGQLPLDQEQTHQATVQALVATGSLVNRLAMRQEEVRAHFAETFTQFASRENQELVKELYGKRPKKKLPVEKPITVSKGSEL